MREILIIPFLLLMSMAVSAVTDSVMFQGQASAYANYNPSNTMDLGTGARFIPQINYEIYLDNASLIDFEGSLNAYGNADFQLFDSASVDGAIKPYRIWGRYSAEQFEVRVGLQKIDFGQAMMLRPLMWFDRVDPRDPLGITDGVYGALGRYYFLDNTNVWLWGLYGNDGTKGIEWAPTADDSFEFGGRVQSPLLSGEMALSFHHREVSLFGNENRLGFDARWDFLVGAYVEGAWVTQNADANPFKNQEFLTLGVDYTFGVGAGLYTVVEHMMVASDEKAFAFENTAQLTALQMSYPIGMFDNLGTILYYDWQSDDIYTFVNWFRQYDKTTFYLMAYWNPEKSLIAMPGMDTSENLMSGKGLQAMVIYNF